MDIKPYLRRNGRWAVEETVNVIGIFLLMNLGRKCKAIVVEIQQRINFLGLEQKIPNLKKIYDGLYTKSVVHVAVFIQGVKEMKIVIVPMVS
jgi:hypothetical protein